MNTHNKIEYHDNFFVHTIYYGVIAEDSETVVYGYETQSPEHQARAGSSIHISAAGGGCFAYVHSGAVVTTFNGAEIEVRAGAWYSTEAGFSFMIGRDTRIAIFQRRDYRGAEAMGKLEASGRLRYIDGCWDTVLAGPIKRGLPCINALYAPPGVHQTMHTHPSTRAGIIIIGNGICQTHSETHQLLGGSIFYLPKNGWHKFRTDTSNGRIVLMAYHPDSDFGPTDENHPMLNRTYVNGTSASRMPEIRTGL